MSYQILIIEDDPTNISLIQNILTTQKNRYKIDTANNGKEAIRKISKAKPDLIITDIRMPQMDGFEFMKELQKGKSSKDIPIIMVTAFDSPLTIKRAFKEGATDYITKPIKKDELLSRIEKALSEIEGYKEVKSQIKNYEKERNTLIDLALVPIIASNSVIIVNPKGEMEWANEGFVKIHGLSLDDFKTKYGNTIFSLSKNTDIINIFNTCLTTKEPTNYISKIKSLSGSSDIWLQIFIAPKLDDNHQVEKLVIIENDITQLKKKEEELNEKNKKLKEITSTMELANKKLEDQTKEINLQKKLLEDEQKKSEQLLLNILPFEIARQLKSKGRAGTRFYKSVSVLFADFKGFSKLSKDLEPKDLVSILDTYFAKFDEIVNTHYLEKIKTIGDAYMCVGGLPLRNNSNPFNAVMAGLEIQLYMNQLNDNKVIQNLAVWELRIGIHTGSVVAGVVGRSKFAYDIWGDTVNIASRMEQTGHTGMVNISGTTYEHIKDFFDCDYRGKIEAKNIGKIDMYFVNRIKDEYSTDELGIYPNDDFINHINRL